MNEGFFDLNVVTIILSIILLLPQDSCASNDIYIVTGNLDFADKYGEKLRMRNPLVDRTFFQYLGDIGNPRAIPETIYRDNNILYTNDGVTVSTGYKDVQRVFNELKAKGYNIHVKNKIETSGLLKVVSDPETVAVFYVGHAHAVLDSATGNIDEKEVGLTVYNKGKTIPLDTQTITTEKRLLNKPYNPGKKLQLFFVGACYSDFCEADLRKDLELSDSVKYVSPTGKKEGSWKHVSISFANEIEPWVKQLPQVSPPPTFCESMFRNLFSRLRHQTEY